MSEQIGKIKTSDAVLANMVSIAAILEYLDGTNPGAKEAIEKRAHEIAHGLKKLQENSPSDGEEEKQS